jgi:NADH-quinone oxidoreductase subunit E
MLRRLYHHQPEAFAFTPANLAWARAQMTKYPEGRQASAIIPLLWRAQEQEGWLSRPAIEHVADMLGLAYIRALEVATFYFMFQLQPVGSVAHVQVCGTLSCMIMGAEDLVSICQKRIAGHAHDVSPDGQFSWEEVECLGACSNAPMVQIGKDYYEDLTPERLESLLDDFAAGKVPVPGPQDGRYSCEPVTGLTSLKDFESGRTQYNGSAQRAVDLKETVKRIDGSEEPLLTPWLGVVVKPPKPVKVVLAAKSAQALHAAKPSKLAPVSKAAPVAQPVKATPVEKAVASTKAILEAKPAKAPAVAKPATALPVAKPAPTAGLDRVMAKMAVVKPAGLKAARGGVPDDLKIIVGVGPALEKLLHKLGFFHFDQIAAWTAKEIAWVDDSLEGFKGRVTRDKWVAQSKKLAKAK